MSSERRREKSRWLHNEETKWTHKFNFWLVELLSGLCSIKLIHSEEYESRMKHKAGHRWKTVWLSRIVRCTFAFCSLHLLLSLCLQYRYDFKLVQLKHRLLQAQSYCPSTRTSNEGGLNSSCWHKDTSDGWEAEAAATDGPLLDDLRRAVDIDRARLRAVGSPHMESSFAVEYLLLGLLLLSFGIYVGPQVYYNFVTPFDLYIVRYILDIDLELDICDAMVAAQTNSFLQSSEMFIRNSLEQMFLNQYPQQNGTTPTCAPRESPKVEVYGDQLYHHRMTRRLLKAMRKSGALLPLNRGAEWIGRTLKLYFQINVALIIYGVLFNCSLITFMLLQTRSMDSEQLHYLDFQLDVDFVLLIAIACASSLLLDVLMICSCLDQVRSVKRLRAVVVRFILMSEIKLETLERRQIDEQLEPLIWQLNRDLLYVMIQFKIFLVQLMSQKRIFAPIPSFYALGVLALAALGRIHTAFVDAKENATFRPLIIMLNLLGMIIVDSCIIPPSRLNSRCLDLFRSLHSLHAHLVESNLNSSVRFTSADGRCKPQAAGDVTKPPRRKHTQVGAIYSEHTISILRRELINPDHLMSKFASSSLGYACNYSNLMRFHFWFGLVILSLVLDLGSTDIISKLIHGPLNS